MSETKEQKSTLIIYLGNEEIKGDFVGTPNEIIEFIENEINRDSILRGEGKQHYGELLSIPVSVLKTNPYRLYPGTQ